MAKNSVQFQKGLSLSAFLSEYGTEEQCARALFHWRWPEGFVCPECSYTGYCELNARKLWQCHRCHHQTSLSAGTLFAYTKLPLRTWFLAMYLLTQSKNGVSAMELARQLGVHYNTAWSVKHKLMHRAAQLRQAPEAAAAQEMFRAGIQQWERIRAGPS